MNFISNAPRKADVADSAKIIAEFDLYYRCDATEQQECIVDDLKEFFGYRGFLSEKQHALLEGIIEQVEGFQNGAD